MLWCDKHTPRRLCDLSSQDGLTALLQRLGATSSLPHLLFYGPSGGGKKTRVMALLRELFGDAVDKVRVETFVEDDSSAEATVCVSNHHVMLSCSELGLKDRAVVQGYIRRLATEAPQAALASSFFSSERKKKTFRVVVLQDVDCLSDNAQHALRRSLETHASSLKFFLIASEVHRVSGPLRSRCLGLRVPLPSVDCQLKVLRDVAKTEKVPDELVPSDLLREIILRSYRNQRRALLALQQILTQNFSLVATGGLQSNSVQNLAQLIKYGAPGGPFPAPWEGLVDNMAAKIASAPSVSTMQEVRGFFYDLLAALIPPDLILARFLKSLFFVKPHLVPPDTSASLEPLDDGQLPPLGKVGSSDRAANGEQKALSLLQLQVVQEAATASLALQRGGKTIMHLEAFAANAMRRFKAYAERRRPKASPV